MQCFFCRDAKGRLLQLITNELDEEILSADGATLNWIIRKMDGKESVFIRNTIEIKISAQ